MFGDDIKVLLLDPWVLGLVVLFSFFGTLFSLAKYKAGNLGIEAVVKHYPQIGQERLQGGVDRLNRHGPPFLLLTAIPGFGTIIPVAAGIAEINQRTFIFWTAIAKFLHFWVLGLILTGALDIFGG